MGYFDYLSGNSQGILILILGVNPCMLKRWKKQSRNQLSKEPGQMRVAATPNCKEGAYWTHRERKEFGGSDQKRFDKHAFYFGYYVTNVFIVP